MTEGPILLVGLAILAGLVIVKWLVFTGLLWIAIKIQKMQYNVLGLLGSSLLATLIGCIPFVGTYLAWVVLVLCLWKVTREDIVPDCVLTVALANAVMFALNLWVIGALMGDLRPCLTAGRNAPPPIEEMAEDLPESEEPDPTPVRVASMPIVPPPVVPAKAAAKAPAPAPVAPVSPLARKPGPAGRSLTPSDKPLVHGLTLKGLIMDVNLPSAMIASGKERFTIQPGESVMVSSSQGNLRIRCEEITQTAVRLDVNDGEKVTLRVR
jgi:hypothetical protein